MKSKHLFPYPATAVVALALLTMSHRSLAANSSSLGNPAVSTNRPALNVQVDPRVELLSLIFRLAGNPEYSQGRIASYTADADQYFEKYREHAVVRLARELRNTHGVSFDACMSMAVHLNNARDLQLLTPLQPWPEGLDSRWTREDVGRFLEAARRFVTESGFATFLQQHRPLYDTTELRLRTLMDKEGHLEWFQEYFGQRPAATFTLTPGMFNGGSCYGSHCKIPGGADSLYCILGVWKTDAEGLPEFSRDMLSTVVHEFAHSYANPIVTRHAAELDPAGEALYKPLSSKMKSQAYGNGHTLLYESLVRVCEVRYAFRYDGPAAGQRAIAAQKARGFLWMEELSKLFEEYETHRDQYPTLEAFSPRLVAFFKDYAEHFGEKFKDLQAKQPKVLSMVPANGSEEVDPSLHTIQVVFDRPMRDGSWSMVGGGPHYPETTGKPGYDSSLKTWSVPVKLKPNWTYEFMLNSQSFDAFRSQDGVPLEPVKVRFKTRP